MMSVKADGLSWMVRCDECSLEINPPRDPNRSKASWQEMWRKLQRQGWWSVKVGEDWLAWEHYCPDCEPENEP